MMAGETGPAGPMGEYEVAEHLCRTLEAGLSGALGARSVSREAQRLWDLLLGMERQDADLFDECFIATMACVDMDCHMLRYPAETVADIIDGMHVILDAHRCQADAGTGRAGAGGIGNSE